ncbi:MAG: poly-gamma-glutamate system protein [Acidobacteriota bacterium]
MILRGRGAAVNRAGGRPYRPRGGRFTFGIPVLLALTASAIGVASLIERSADRLQAPKPGEAAGPRLDLRAAAAAETMRLAKEHLAAAKLASGIEPAPGVPAADAGLVGAELTPLVTTLGSLDAKILAASPAWAAELTRRLHGAGLRAGDTVAAGFSGSFPGLNLAVMAACQALELDLVAVSSVTASTWGANQPGFTWPEIEVRLTACHLLQAASVAVTIGGAGDCGLDLAREARTLARALQVNAARSLAASAPADCDLETAINARMDLFERRAAPGRIALYINVGGTQASLGRSAAVLRVDGGFLPAQPFDLSRERGVIARFAERGVPVLSLLDVADLAARWGLRQRG